MKHLTHAAALVLAAGLTPTFATTIATVPAHASGDDDRVIRTGSCSDGARWKIKAKQDDGRLEVEAEIDSNRSGQTWTWRLTHNGDLAAKGTSQTTGRSGSFDVERRTVDNPGTDAFVFRAARAGQTCVATLSY